MTTRTLNGCRVLVAEDNADAALRVEAILEGLGCIVIGPFSTVPKAREAARSTDIDLALLDVNLSGALSYPVAEILAERAVPFLLLTGYGEHAVPEDHPDWQWHSKPYSDAALIKQIEDLIDRRG